MKSLGDFPRVADIGDLGAKGRGGVRIFPLSCDGGTWVPSLLASLCSFHNSVASFFLPLQCDWLNSYHQTCRDVVGKELQSQGRQEALEWLIRETEPVSRQH